MHLQTELKETEQYIEKRAGKGLQLLEFGGKIKKKITGKEVRQCFGR